MSHVSCLAEIEVGWIWFCYVLKQNLLTQENEIHVVPRGGASSGQSRVEQDLSCSFAELLSIP